MAGTAQQFSFQKNANQFNHLPKIWVQSSHLALDSNSPEPSRASLVKRLCYQDT